ncbi:MAG: ABC transporter ATP-binding protein [Nitrospirae bacterium]|nr:ABC transporter ATP-binding protein [Nitrospirota bacterium]
MSETLLSLENISVSFPHGTGYIKAVDGVSFDVGREETVGVVGESGSGKTLTALSIMRLLPPNAAFSGKTLFKGLDISSLGNSELQKIRGKDISMVFQEPMTSLNPVLTVGYQIAEALAIHSGISMKEALSEAAGLLRRVNIPSPESRAREYPHQLSGGMRQRAMIAMAIACGPSLIIADEPTTALDVTIQAQILELLGSLKEINRMSLLLITHDLGIVSEWASRVVVMYAGRVVENAPAKEIFINPKHPYTLGLIESLPRRKGEKLLPIPGQVPAPDALPKGCKFSSRCKYVVSECLNNEPELSPAGSSEHLSRCVKAMVL